VGGAGGSYQNKLSEVQKNDNASYLPGSAESTQVGNEAAKFSTSQSLPGFVVFRRASGLTDADKAWLASVRNNITAVPGVDAAAVGQVLYSTNQTVASIYAPLIAQTNGVSVNGNDLVTAENKLLDVVKSGQPQGLETHSAGPGGLLVAIISAFGGLDSTLLFAAFGVVVLILLVVYRSPVLWVFPLLSAGLALGLASMIIYYLAKHGVLTLTGQSQGILSVLILGAGTDYALLLISRYREELHNYQSRADAMIKAWRESAPAIIASALTVIIGLLCLSFSELNSNKSLGPVAAIGIGCTLLVMMSFLPVALAASGRWVFWPRRPSPATPNPEPGTAGFWGRVSRGIGAHPRRAWLATTVLLLVFGIGIVGLKTDGLTTAQSFTGTPDAVIGQNIYDANFARGVGAPAVIAVNATAVDQVIATTRAVPGISQSPGAVCVMTDLNKVRALAQRAGGAGLGSGGTGGGVQQSAACPSAALQVTPIDGRTIIDATLADSYDSPAAYDTIARLRTAVHAIPGADAKVGGQSAATLDVHNASIHDRNLILPIVLVVIFIVLALLLRAILAPILLILTVVLSFGATLGVCGWAFRHIFHFGGADQSFPLFAFVFLVALGIDYNIFLMTRVREETLKFGTRRGVVRGLAVTGGVITSAGVVLAATFAVLGVLPIVFLAEIGFAVAFGVLLDTLIVRTILVPALAYDIGRAIWWPSKLATAQK
jgi:RND superfamily putative drug exporter